MLNMTFSADSVRGYRNFSQEIISPVTFTYVNTIFSNLSNPLGSNIAITNNGNLIICTSNTTFDNTATNTTRLISNYFTSYNSFKLSNYPNPYTINGFGNIIINIQTAPGNLEINEQTGLYSYSPIANIDVGAPNANFNISDISVSTAGDIFAVSVINSNALQSPAGYAHIYSFDGSNVNLQANIDIDPVTTPASFSSRINLNNSGNYVVLTTPTSGNVQIWNKTGNSWSLQSNINVTGENGVINQYGNICAINVRANVSNDITQIYTRSGNTWNLLQNVSSYISGVDQIRKSLDMTADGNIIAISVSYDPSANNNSRIEILNYDDSNGNFTLTQTIYGNSNIDLGIGSLFNGLSLSKNTGYLIATSGNNNIEVYTCL